MVEAAAEKDKKQAEEIGLNTIILAGLERGLQMQDIKRMPLGRLVDFVIDYNKRQKEAEQKAERRDKATKHYRLATKDEVDALVRG